MGLCKKDRTGVEVGAVGSEETTCLLNQRETEGAREKEKYNENIRTRGREGEGMRASMRKREGCGEEAGRRTEGGAVTTCLENQCSPPTCNATPSALFSDGQNKTQSRAASQAEGSNYSQRGKIYPKHPLPSSTHILLPSVPPCFSLSLTHSPTSHATFKTEVKSETE